jgi:hypothetical protein
MDTEVRGKILCLSRGSNPDGQVVQPVARHYTDSGSQFDKINVKNLRCTNMDWMYLCQERGQRQAVMNTTMNFCIL